MRERGHILKNEDEIWIEDLRMINIYKPRALQERSKNEEMRG